MTEILCNAFRTVIATTPGNLLATVYLTANKIAPPHEGLELGIGEASLVKALAEAYGRKEEHVKKQNSELGDLGLVAKASRSTQRLMFQPKPLTIDKVFSAFLAIAKQLLESHSFDKYPFTIPNSKDVSFIVFKRPIMVMAFDLLWCKESGANSHDKKKNHIKGLLVAATECEPLYITRLLQSKMRIGLAEKTVLVALGQAAAYSETCPNPPLQTQSPLEEVGVPIGPMLAKPTKAVSEIIDKFQGMEFTCEYKYDGERAQIHYMEDGSVEIYSRNAEWNTGKYPDVVSSISREKFIPAICKPTNSSSAVLFKKDTAKSFVLDCEIVAYDHEKQKILPFQVLSTRARKGVILSGIKVTVCTFAFDILYINGQPLLQEQLKVRRQHLYSSFEEVPGVFQFATATITNDVEEIQKFLEAAVNSSCEGLIIKTLDKDATYEPSKRSNNWLKLKKDYMESIGDSLDLVPIAAFHGRGKRTGVYGSFLLACYDEQNEEYQTICNIGTGFSESQLEERSASLRNKVIPTPKPYYRYADTVNPDVWFEPAEVWEVKAADLSISPVHRAASGIVYPNKGISLRFPRLVHVRDDKSPEQATTSDQVADMYRAQKINHANNHEEEDDD
ncbi:DNA ligase 1 [Cocos nucifera]|uniref:DNA ligase n=1 Tax=Cocos nucifera TaxID=13894 RepID=A0A8K0I148_COCNU|nr:DNA ligase 1 [Cocos nucifera]